MPNTGFSNPGTAQVVPNVLRHSVSLSSRRLGPDQSISCDLAFQIQY